MGLTVRLVIVALLAVLAFSYPGDGDFATPVFFSCALVSAALLWPVVDQRRGKRRR